MIIISDCVKNDLDEGCIKLASSLSKRLRKKGAFLVAINSQCDYADAMVRANKVFTNRKLYETFFDRDGDILYIPMASNTLGTAIRTLNLTRRSKKKVSVLFTMRWGMNYVTKQLYRKSGCNIITVSQDSFKYFNEQFPELYVENVKTGVDTHKFSPVVNEEKYHLRKKYGIPEDKVVILHVGHLKYGRNIDKFLNIDEQYHVLLVFSSVTEKNSELRKRLEEKNNIQIIDDYISNIEEIYQASDIYIFPVVEESNSIDIPLSVLEAASCNLKVIATPYKEIAFFKQTLGYIKIGDNQVDDINAILSDVVKSNKSCTREIALDYSWDTSVQAITELID